MNRMREVAEEVELMLEQAVEPYRFGEHGPFTVKLSPDKFRETLAHTIVRGSTKVTELLMWHEGQEVRVQCDGDPPGLVLYLDGTIRYT